MRHLNTEFCFHPVGQGCFYTGSFSTGKGPIFNFVYDCGTKSKSIFLQSEIEKFKSTINNKTIDLIIISHFDKDHISGVVQLLDGFHCKNLIIPYYTSIERYALYLETSPTDDEYRRILQNPISFFTINDRFVIDNIVVIGETDIDESFIANDDQSEPFDDENYELEINLLDEDERESVIQEIIGDFQEEIRSNKLQFMKRPFRIKFYIWEFIFYNRKPKKNSSSAAFSKVVSQYLKKNGLKIADLFDTNRVKVMQGIYKSRILSKINLTSLVLYHGPINLNRWNARVYFLPYISPLCDLLNYFLFPPCRFGTLLTGDSDLSDKNKIADVINYFGKYKCFEKIALFQVPHHGAKRSWSIAVPNGLNNFNIYVLNYGTSQSDHPSTEVVEYIETNCKKIALWHNTEFNKLHLKVEFKG
ncbi:MAG: hypothetical protein IPJ75_07160 [Ignavibacteriales bacterium]|nr:hypothetical protein [Ignavibacteriales bacterium]